MSRQAPSPVDWDEPTEPEPPLPRHPRLLEREARRPLPNSVLSGGGCAIALAVLEIMHGGAALLDGTFDGVAFARTVMGGAIVGSVVRLNRGSVRALDALLLVLVALLALIAATFPWEQHASLTTERADAISRAILAVGAAAVLLYHRPRAHRAVDRRRRAEEALRRANATDSAGVTDGGGGRRAGEM